MQYHAEPGTHHTSKPFHYTSPSPEALIVPGLNGSCGEHWQSVWEKERGDCARADLGNWANPTPETWVKRLDDAIRASSTPVVLVAHSLGCIATALWCQLHLEECRDIVQGALLVAPCDPEADHAAEVLRRFAPIPKRALGIPSVLIASSNDPYATLERSQQLAEHWGGTFINAGAVGHINARSNLGYWNAGQSFLNRLQGKVATGD